MCWEAQAYPRINADKFLWRQKQKKCKNGVRALSNMQQQKATSRWAVTGSLGSGNIQISVRLLLCVAALITSDVALLK